MIPAAWAVYFISRDSADNKAPFFTRMIDGYTETTEKWSKRNDLHVRMIEQAGEDRVLFQNSRPVDHVEMKFPEYVQESHIAKQASRSNLEAGEEHDVVEVR